MTNEIFTNQPSTTVLSGGTTAPAPGTVESWTVASSATFPAASSSAVPPTQFHVCDVTIGSTSEIIAVTNVSGTTWTVTRGAEGTTPVVHTTGFTVQQVVTAGWLTGVQTAIPGALLTDRGAIAASTTYNPGDSVAYRGQRVLIPQTVTSSSWPNWFTPPTLTSGSYVPITSQAFYYAADWGVVTDGVTDNSGALNRALQFMSKGENSGGFLILPDGYSPAGQVVGVSSTVIIPPGCYIVGNGIETSCIRANANMNADVIQFQTFNSTSQATIISAATGVSTSASSLRNAYYAGLMNLCVHGNKASQGTGQYNYGVSIITNPLLTTTGTDPDFDPSNILFNVEIRSCTGDGFFQNGRSQLRATNVISRYNDGNGFTPSFDSLYIGCNAGFNGVAGFYFNHQALDGAANKSYNNGAAAQWVSGSNYSARTVVMYNGVLYRAINALTSDTVVPSSDPTNWAALTSTSPQAWGIGYYFDSNCQENAWSACDSQENAASDYYFYQCVGVNVSGVSNRTAFGAVSNPNYYSAVVLNGANGCTVNVSFTLLNSIAYVLRVVGSSTHNDIRMTGDTSYAAIITPDTITLVGSGNSVKINGTYLTDDTAPAFTPTGLTGAVAASRYVGATTSGAPVSGTFAVGDHIVDQTGKIWVCTVAGTPGTWVNVAGSSSFPGFDSTLSHVQPDGTQTLGSIGLAADSGHVHPDTVPWTVTDSGYLAWNFDPGPSISSSTTLTNSTVTLIRVNIRKAISVTNVLAYVANSGVSLVSGENFAGLYTSSGSLVAATADQTTAWSTNGLKTMALSSGPYALTAGTFYWVALLANESGGSTPAFSRGPSVNATLQNAGLAGSVARWATNGTGTVLSGSITPSSNTAIQNSYWAALS